jgi:hypothetical protein
VGSRCRDEGRVRDVKASAFNFVVCAGIKKSSVQVKINHVSGSESCVYSWYITPHGSKQFIFKWTMDIEEANRPQQKG